MKTVLYFHRLLFPPFVGQDNDLLVILVIEWVVH